MIVQQFRDEHLSQFSYAVLSESAREIVLIDPARDPRPYLRFAEHHRAKIIGVIETHPHADFVSSHLEFHRKSGAAIYGSRLQHAGYPLKPFDEGQVLEFGGVRLKALNTPGHSPDSISVVLEHEGRDRAVFTGDTLFIGDCGRPDLRESGDEQETLRTDLARRMYHSLRDKLAALPDDVVVYPGHGAGSLCGKSMSDAQTGTIGEEKKYNWSLQDMPESRFVEQLTSDLPFIPAYFPYNVELNKKGAPEFRASVEAVPVRKRPLTDEDARSLSADLWVVDTRDEREFKSGHLPRSVNIMDGDRFETWLGSVIRPGEDFYLAGSDHGSLERLIARVASIGYERQVREAFVPELTGQKDRLPDLADLRSDPGRYTILDVRNPAEIKDQKFFQHAMNIPLSELRDRVQEIPAGKPVAVHCAGGYRSAIASSLLSSELEGKTRVYDIGAAIREFG
ncbi:MAG TPA: MBL fold metallo-hydrolase [Sphingobacteriaceae bacterium]